MAVSERKADIHETKNRLVQALRESPIEIDHSVTQDTLVQRLQELKKFIMKSNLRLIDVFWIGVVLTIGACTMTDELTETEREQVAEHMHDYLDQISAVKASVIAGNLEASRRAVTRLAEQDEPRFTPRSRAPYVEEMRRYARQAASAEDLVTAAAAIGETARTCGDCHRASGVVVAFGYDQRPANDAQNLTTQMQGHLWAADRMWDGLIGPSDQAWKLGTEMLAEMNLAASNITDEPARQTQIDVLVRRMRSLAQQGNQAASIELRSGLYGEFLSLCASCHSLAGAGPGS